MKNEILQICCFVFLVVGSILVFLAKEIVDKFNVSNNVKCENICKTVGYIVLMVSLIGIYVLNI